MSAEDVWDNSELMEAFDHAIKTHKRKGSLKRNYQQSYETNEKEDTKQPEKYVCFDNDDANYPRAQSKPAGIIFIEPEQPSLIADAAEEREDGEEYEDAVAQNNSTEEGEITENAAPSDMYAAYYSSEAYHASYYQQEEVQQAPQLSQQQPQQDNTGDDYQNTDRGVEKGVIPIAAIDTDAALADMLHAWYQSGYLTGRYHTLVELKRLSGL